jgi:hypothetical protein
MMRASAFSWPRSVLSAWGEPARPGFPPEGETDSPPFSQVFLKGWVPFRAASKRGKPQAEGGGSASWRRSGS